MIITPHQDFFNICRDIAIKLIGEENVYDFLPPKGAKYPFIYIGAQQHVEDTWKNKDAIYPTIYQDIYIYNDNPLKRGSTSKLAMDFVSILRTINTTNIASLNPNYDYHFNEITFNLRPDNTAEVPLMQAHIYIELKSY